MSPVGSISEAPSTGAFSGDIDDSVQNSATWDDLPSTIDHKAVTNLPQIVVSPNARDNQDFMNLYWWALQNHYSPPTTNTPSGLSAYRHSAMQAWVPQAQKYYDEYKFLNPKPEASPFMSMKDFGNRESIALMTAPLVAAGGALKGLANFGYELAQGVMRGYEYQGATQASMYASTPADFTQVEAERSAIYAQPISPLFEMSPLEQAGSDALGVISFADLGAKLLTETPKLVDSAGGLFGGLREGAEVPNAGAVDTAAAADGAPVTVYRVEGTPNQRLVIDDAGNVSIAPDNNSTIWLNFGESGRATDYLSTKVAQGLTNAQLKSFDIDPDFLQQVQNQAIPEQFARSFPNSPIISADPFPNQFGIRQNQFQQLLDSIYQGTGKNVPPH